MKFRYSRMLAALVVSAVMVAGCGSNQQQAGDVSVNAYKITASDAQVNQTFAGTVVAENSVAVHARVTGYVVEKFVKGGEQVVAGQPLYRIDSRQYEASLANAEAQAAQANANLKNAEVDLQRYETLAQQDAIAQQRVIRNVVLLNKQKQPMKHIKHLLKSLKITWVILWYMHHTLVHCVWMISIWAHLYKLVLQHWLRLIPSIQSLLSSA